MEHLDAAFFFALLKIVWADILLSGDNAVVIALATRKLPPRRQRQAIVGGAAAAILMRVTLALFAVRLLELPWLKLVGAALLVWIGTKLMNQADEEAEVGEADGLWAAVRTILLADLAMSLDNVVAIAAAASAAAAPMRPILLLIGLGLSIPLIIFGSTLLLRLMQRFPAIITLGAALLGFVAGEMAVTDAALRGWFDTNLHDLAFTVGIAGAILVVALGLIRSRRGSA
ncbi:TerC family protein [Roseateles asaccharophilus]|uniref:YjbE family integral membrane protein n=1 Tax=Roseateles asaccharophilus TaxID=582607 RepID=A0ABU2A891_9BURK|nr:TerC family protein [Roseateles asaccharophilus]MDR7333355.1 YjbE family integral membrane protein [Roseateles asaccharophilus]